jgi:Glycogen recognition site of AMP-activated protein kinase
MLKGCSSQDFSAVLELPPGTHRLKFIVDDEWKCSNDLEAATDPDGNLVNYIEVDDGLDDDLDEFGERRSSLEDSSNGKHWSCSYYHRVVHGELISNRSISAFLVTSRNILIRDSPIPPNDRSAKP